MPNMEETDSVTNFDRVCQPRVQGPPQVGTHELSELSFATLDHVRALEERVSDMFIARVAANMPIVATNGARQRGPPIQRHHAVATRSCGRSSEKYFSKRAFFCFCDFFQPLRVRPRAHTGEDREA